MINLPSNRNAFLEFSSWIKNSTYSKIPISMDLSIRLQWIRKFWLGTGMATNGRNHIQIGGYINSKFMWGTGFNFQLLNPLNKDVSTFGNSFDFNFQYIW